MSDFRFLSGGIDGATLTYTGADTGYPITNIQDRNKNTFFKDSAIGANTIDLEIDFGENTTCDFIFLGNYLATADNTARIDVHHDDNDSFSSPTTVLSNSEIDSATLTDKYIAITSGGERYWRIHFEDSAAGDLINLQIGYILMGAKYDLDHNPEYEIPEESGYNIAVKEAAGGARFSQISNTTKRRIWEYQYKAINTTEKTALETWRDNIFMDLNGGLSRYPFIFTDDGGTTHYFVRAIGSLLLTPQAYQLYETNLRLEEEL